MALDERLEAWKFSSFYFFHSPPPTPSHVVVFLLPIIIFLFVSLFFSSNSRLSENWYRTTTASLHRRRSLALYLNVRIEPKVNKHVRVIVEKWFSFPRHVEDDDDDDDDKRRKRNKVIILAHCESVSFFVCSKGEKFSRRSSAPESESGQMKISVL